MAASSDSPKYVYGIIDSHTGLRFETKGVGDPAGTVRTIEVRDVAALVSDIERFQVEGNRGNLLAHSRVLEEVGRQFTVLPMRFGIVLPDEESVKNDVIEPRYELWREQLERFDGLIELTLKAVYYAEPVLREILEEDPSVAEMRDRARSSSGERAYFDNITLGEVVAQHIEAKGEKDAEAMVDRLRGLSVDIKVNPVTVERMLLNAAFLVRREHLGSFDREVNEIGARMGDRVHFKYLGPLPPYSFVQMALERAE